MSIPLIDRNDDLRKLRDEKYDVSIVENNIVVRGIPYVNRDRKILFGTIYCPLELSVERTVPPSDHTVRFMGEYPCDQFGKEDHSFVNSPQNHTLNSEIVGTYYFSSKPGSGRYQDFYIKMKRYIDLLSSPAKSLDPGVSAQNFDQAFYTENSVFKYTDTYTARAELSQISKKIKDQKIAIVGLGGTGSYVLDFLSKTPVKKISIFDGDEMLNHNAFRIPGAMTLEELKDRPNKAAYFYQKYDVLRHGIEKHEVYLTETNVSLLDDHDFVFLAIDESEGKSIIIAHLLASEIPFVDLGMGLSVVDNSIRGTIRKTLVTPENRSCLHKITMGPIRDEDLYSQNIQISELNALNAILGVIAWKKLNGFYLTEDDFMNSIFIVDEEGIINET